MHLYVALSTITVQKLFGDSEKLWNGFSENPFHKFSEFPKKYFTCKVISVGYYFLLHFVIPVLKWLVLSTSVTQFSDGKLHYYIDSRHDTIEYTHGNVYLSVKAKNKYLIWMLKLDKDYKLNPPYKIIIEEVHVS